MALEHFQKASARILARFWFFSFVSLLFSSKQSVGVCFFFFSSRTYIYMHLILDAFFGF